MEKTGKRYLIVGTGRCGSSLLSSLLADAGQVGYELFGMKAFFVDDWKILRMPPPAGSGGWELFNLQKDPAELNDLSGEFPERLAEMIALWERYKEENGVLDIALDPNQ